MEKWNAFLKDYNFMLMINKMGYDPRLSYFFGYSFHRTLRFYF